MLPSTENERELGNLVRVKHGTDFFILDQYPLSARPFYTMPSAQDPKFSNSFDIIMRGEEICSGAQRVHDHDLLCERMLAHGLKPQSEAFEDYVNAFKFGCSPHGGVGIGLERIVKLLLGLPSVKQAGTFPRDPSRLRP
jgi:aspartyl/asparaginyl-tRNA synthetase